MCHAKKGDRKEWGEEKAEAEQHLGKGRTHLGPGSQADWSVSVP